MNENIKDPHGHIDDVNDIGILSDRVVYIMIYVAVVIFISNRYTMHIT